MTKTSFDLNKAMQELEAISSWFQDEDVDLEKGLAKLKRAKELMALISARLKKVENDFTEIKADLA
jgi:exodeoxyribonuclease VII small subunit